MALKTVLVTGCSAGGIGAAIALALAQRGHHVFATARTVSKISPDLSQLTNVTPLQLDVTSSDSVAKAAEAVSASGRGLDILINNAGAGYAMPVLDVDISKAQKLYEVNVWGPLRTVQAFAKQLIASRGRIVNVSTVAAIINVPWISTYASSKAAFTTYAETMRLELSPFGVSVVTIMTGTVETHFHDNEAGFALPPASRYAPIEEIIAGWVDGTSVPKGCTAAEFAESLVDSVIIDGTATMAFKGPNAGGVGFVAKWAPQFVSVSCFFLEFICPLDVFVRHVARWIRG
ncbi:dehydrogenase with different specificitie [Xylaria intraflava]|nr:dehydrogenase with different specificitie [Xylaria intraflava]